MSATVQPSDLACASAACDIVQHCRGQITGSHLARVAQLFADHRQGADANQQIAKALDVLGYGPTNDLIGACEDIVRERSKLTALLDGLGRHIEFQVHDGGLPCFAVIDPVRRREIATPLHIEIHYFLEQCFDERIEL